MSMMSDIIDAVEMSISRNRASALCSQYMYNIAALFTSNGFRCGYVIVKTAQSIVSTKQPLLMQWKGK